VLAGTIDMRPLATTGGRVRRLLPARWLAAIRTQADSRWEATGDVARESRWRIRAAAGLGSAAYTFFLVAEGSGVLHDAPLERAVDLTHDIAGATLCALMFLLTLWGRIRDRHVLTLALVLELLISALISLMNTWAGYLHSGHLPGLTWVVPIMLLFALLVPAPPRELFLVSSACAATMPLGIAALAANGRVLARAPDYWASSLAAIVGLGLAVVAARTLYGARREVAAAQRMGGYELVRLIDQGGMGAVWEARHLMLARPAAVKLILGERLQAAAEAREAVVQRFTREAQITASLRSPYTVQLFDFGVTSDGALYYAMELLQGMNLEHYLGRHGALEPRRAVHWLRQICHSLGEAHASGLTHRDLKPSNLLVCHYGREHDFVKVLDFGLARRSAAADEPKLTRQGAWLGTPGWMAPEQIFAGAVDARTDLYALGCVAYWLLSGERLFETDEQAELLRLHAQGEPVRLAERAHQPIPPALEAVVMACVAKDAGARPRDADEVSARLAASVPGEPWTSADAEAWWNANRDAR
jgi:serine/threonine-protein kinase